MIKRTITKQKIRKTWLMSLLSDRAPHPPRTDEKDTEMLRGVLDNNKTASFIVSIKFRGF